MSDVQLFPALDPATEAALRHSIRRWGVLVPIFVSAGPWQKGTVLDGHHRSRIAEEEGCGPPATIPIPVEKEEDAHELARTLNMDRRHLDVEQRRLVVADLRAAGFSLRDIAGAVGTSQTQVARDLDSAGVTNVTPAEVRGKDGKMYPATRPAIGTVEEREEFASGEFDALLDELDAAYGDDLTDEIIDQAIEDNLDSKRTPEPTKPDFGGGISHPARYSDSLMPIFIEELAGFWNVLDPFAGTGRIHELEAHGFETTGVEIEEPWAALHERTILGTALNLPFGDDIFDAICTSPTYGNRMADHHNAQDGSYRRTYAHDLGRDLTEGNSGAMQWGPEYRALHRTAWQEAIRVLRPGGRLVLNIKNHVRASELQLVSHWHVATLAELGLVYLSGRAIPTPSLRYGANADLRMDHEYVFVMDKPHGCPP